jgi:mycobactin polyketide synthetase MbtD
MTPADALAVGLAPFQGNAIVLAYDFDRARPMLEAYGYGPLISQLTSPVIDTSKTVEQQAPAAAKDISQRLMSLLANAIGVDRAETIDTSIPMVAIGLDSLQALELRRRVKIEFNHELEVADLLGGASIADVMAKLGG